MSKEKPLSHSESGKIIHEDFLEWLKGKENKKENKKENNNNNNLRGGKNE